MIVCLFIYLYVLQMWSYSAELYTFLIILCNYRHKTARFILKYNIVKVSNRVRAVVYIRWHPGSYVGLFVCRCSEQACLRQQVVEDDTEDWQGEPGFSGLQRVGGVDLSFVKGDDVSACAQLVVLSYPALEVSCPPHYAGICDLWWWKWGKAAFVTKLLNINITEVMNIENIMKMV